MDKRTKIIRAARLAACLLLMFASFFFMIYVVHTYPAHESDTPPDIRPTPQQVYEMERL